MGEGGGTVIVLEVTPAKSFLPYKVEWKLDKIELLSFTEAGNSGVAVLYVPYGNLKAFERRIEAYMVDPPKDATRAHLTLVSVIDDIRQAEFTDLWTDADSPPAETEVGWFQLWLRAHNTAAKPVYDSFKAMAPALGIELDEGYVRFPGRVVVAVRATRAQLAKAAGYLDNIAEIRGVQPTTGFFVSTLTPRESAEWVNSLRERITFVDHANASRVTLLDTGVNTGHPLLANAVPKGDAHAFNPQWGVHDHEGHGTEMAGISLYGNLTGPLATTKGVTLSHQLESVKIWPPKGQNPPHLYGNIMWQAAGHVEVRNPHAKRVFAMMTTEEGARFGMPTEWSATLDQMAFGRLPIQVGLGEQPGNRTPRLFVLAGGNVPVSDWRNYPTINHLTSVKSPGQSWNAITVGACTNLVDLDTQKFPSLSAIAQAGELSPCSSTGLGWQPRWPHKPDVVAEGGNGAIEAGLHVVDGPEDLRLLTTSHEPTKRLLAETGGTSAASADVARLCAMLTAQYPDYWPETIRGLVLHGARYTPSMLKQQAGATDQMAKQALLRTYGFGLVGADTSAFSTRHRPTLVLQEEIRPFVKKDGSIRLGMLNLHSLPWPAEALHAIAQADLTLRVTLSYFVEPNPSRRGWLGKFRYASHGLRFATRAATEGDAEFLARINKLARIEDDEEPIAERQGGEEKAKPRYPDPDVSGWDFGPRLRVRGSVHSDVWRGTAADLVNKGQIAVFPVGGWWKDWNDTQQWSNTVRYALIVSLEASKTIPVDLYTPIQQAIQTSAVVVDIPTGDEE
ncbi:S8 family peptidase [Ralstonia pseudosolanacearum]